VRPWDAIPIEKGREPLVALSRDSFSFETPHPYVALGPPYGAWSPWFLRRSVQERLLEAQRLLQSGWRLHLLDAWRPMAVQAFMVEHTDALLRRTEPALDDVARGVRVLSYWAPPSENPTTPPPHSTGAVVDLTLVGVDGRVANMGSPFDEPTERSHPAYFSSALDAHGREAHANQQVLDKVMRASGFVRHPREWWHFSYGDRTWARENDLEVARYGRTSPD
jgi:zinc D-Ala-D-Ala dipeptidase